MPKHRVTRFSPPAAKHLVATLICAAWFLVPTQAASGKTFMWKATKGQGAIYLVGSVHALSQDFYPLAPALEDGFKDSDTLVEEVDIGEMSTQAAAPSPAARDMLPPGQSLDQLVSPATMALVNKAGADLACRSTR